MPESETETSNEIPDILSKTVKFSELNRFSIELPESVTVSKYSFNSLSCKVEISSSTNSKLAFDSEIPEPKEIFAPASKAIVP